MIVIDTSAVVAYLASEPEAGWIGEQLGRASECHMSAFNVFECRVVFLRGFEAKAVGELETFIASGRIVVDPFDDEQAMLAFDAYRRFGKGSGHRAQLNMGDCAAYALARSLRVPLLFKGEDFSRTDVARLS